jgi:HTH-type transcriptional regulator, transcriptional repressor of NAD biosynthesis genes
MRRGLVLGKFMPIHNGHIKLIEYAVKQCDLLYVWICVSNKEPISGELRFNWIKDIFKNNDKIKPVLFEYDESLLPNTSESSRQVSEIWAKVIKQNLPIIDVIISSEQYGDFVAEFLNIKHKYFPICRITSATAIRNNPYKNWEFIPDIVKPFFYRKVCLLGTESTGKSTLTKRIAKYFDADFVSEVGRNVVENTNTCQFSNLVEIARTHAEKIISMKKYLNKMLIIDTDITITKSYSKFLFNQELYVDTWIKDANKCDLYLYLDNDAPYIQDGTRLSETARNLLDKFHKKELQESNIQYFLINGTWDKRFKESLRIIHEQFKIK